ncbi:MAG: hypothetical protein QXZ20_03530, partial [Candidatus Aenigmatarchaeota archaeon]
MPENIKKSRVVLGVITLGIFLFIVSFLIFIQKAEPYQIKRVIRGNYTLPTDAETATQDISTLLGDEELNTTTSFIVGYRRMAIDSRRKADAIIAIDDPTHILVSRREGSTASSQLPIEYQIAEFIPGGVNVVSGFTVIPDTAISKNITLPYSFNLTRSFPIINWLSYATATNADEINCYVADLKSSKVLEIKRSETATNYNNEVYYQVIEFDRDVVVTKNTTTLNSTTDNLTVNISYANITDANRTLLIMHILPSSATAGVEGRYYVQGQLINNTHLFFRRYTSGADCSILWYLVEFKNNAFSKSDKDQLLGSTSLTLNTTVNVVPQWDLNRTLSVFYLQLNSTATGVFEQAMATGQLFSSGSDVILNVTRNVSGSYGMISYNIIEWPPLDVNYPNEAENFTVGENRTISWYVEDKRKNSTFQIRLCKNNCNYISNYNILVNNVTGYNSSLINYTWKINSSIGGYNPINETLRLAVIDIGLRNWSSTNQTSRNWDISNSNFTIRGDLIIDSPTSSSIWYVGDNSTIS